MLTGTTVQKLRDMHLGVMAGAFEEQISDPRMSELSFEDRMSMIVDREWTSRKNNRLKKLINDAKFADTDACIENIDYLPDRKLDKSQILSLAKCDYVFNGHNVLLLGATGCGKTYLACALGMSAARNFLTVKYIRLPELFTELAIARGSNTIRKLLAQYKKYSLLIIDEWLLYPLRDTESRDLLEIIEARAGKSSTIFCSQFDIPGWREKIGDPIVADAICDRIVHNSYKIIIESKESMRKIKGISND